MGDQDQDREATERGAPWSPADPESAGFVEALRVQWPPDDPEFLARVRQRISAAAPEHGSELAARIDVELAGEHPVVVRAVRAEWPPNDSDFLARVGRGGRRSGTDRTTRL